MKERKMELNARNIILYLLGFFVMGLGVNLMLRSGVGGGAWDTVTYNLHVLIDSTLGTASLLISTVIMLIVIISRKKPKFFLMILPIFLVSASIDLWDLVILGDLEPTSMLMQIIWYILSTFILPLGLSLIIVSHFPAFVFDELMLLIMDLLHTNKMSWVRIGIEMFAIVLAIILGLIAGIGLGSVNIGSIIFAFTIGPIIAFYVRTYYKIIGREHTHE